MIDRAPTIFAIITGLLVAFSVFFDWAYFLIIDPRFFRTMAVADHVSAALEQIPAFSIGTAIGLFMALLMGVRQAEQQTLANELPVLKIGNFIMGVYILSWPSVMVLLIAMPVILMMSFKNILLFAAIFYFIWPKLSQPLSRRLREGGHKWAVSFFFDSGIYRLRPVARTQERGYRSFEGRGYSHGDRTSG